MPQPGWETATSARSSRPSTSTAARPRPRHSWLLCSRSSFRRMSGARGSPSSRRVRSKQSRRLRLRRTCSRTAMLTAIEQAELAALESLTTQAETVAEFIARMTPKYAPIPEHLQRLTDVLDAAREGEVYATVALPVRMGKTETLAHGLAHRCVSAPAPLHFYTTFGAGLSFSTSRRVRKLVRAAGMPLSPEAQAVNDWRTVYDGGLKATSVGGDVTGRGCKGGLIVADDLIKGRKFAESKTVRDDAWNYLRDDLMSRLEPGSSFIVPAARWHQDDIIGRLHEDPLGLNWIHIEIPAVIGPNGEADDERIDTKVRSIRPNGWG